jgi:hypothetical protein
MGLDYSQEEEELPCGSGLSIGSRTVCSFCSVDMEIYVYNDFCSKKRICAIISCGLHYCPASIYGVFFYKFLSTLKFFNLEQKLKHHILLWNGRSS